MSWQNKKRELQSAHQLNQIRMISIGLAIRLYADGHHGQYPDTLSTLLVNEQMTTSLLICPASDDEPAAGDTPAEIETNLARPGHLSYIYLGKGFTRATVKEQQVIAYDRPGNHHAGMNILFGNGHVEWFSETAANGLIVNAMTQAAAP